MNTNTNNNNVINMNVTNSIFTTTVINGYWDYSNNTIAEHYIKFSDNSFENYYIFYFDTLGTNVEIENNGNTWENLDVDTMIISNGPIRINHRSMTISNDTNYYDATDPKCILFDYMNFNHFIDILIIGRTLNAFSEYNPLSMGVESTNNLIFNNLNDNSCSDSEVIFMYNIFSTDKYRKALRVVTNALVTALTGGINVIYFGLKNNEKENPISDRFFPFFAKNDAQKTNEKIQHALFSK